MGGTPSFGLRECRNLRHFAIKWEAPDPRCPHADHPMPVRIANLITLLRDMRLLRVVTLEMVVPRAVREPVFKAEYMGLMEKLLLEIKALEKVVLRMPETREEPSDCSTVFAREKGPVLLPGLHRRGMLEV